MPRRPPGDQAIPWGHSSPAQAGLGLPGKKRPGPPPAAGRRIVVALTGASGMRYGVRLLEVLKESGCERTVVLTDGGLKVLGLETGLCAGDVRALSSKFFKNSQLEAPVASGSQRFDAMVVCPCTMSTASKIACGISDNLVTRVAAVALKERRTLVIVPRETPLSTVQLRNLAALSELGVVVLPAMPAFYGRPQRLEELVDFIVGRVLDGLGIENRLYRRWAEK